MTDKPYEFRWRAGLGIQLTGAKGVASDHLLTAVLGKQMDCICRKSRAAENDLGPA